MAGVIEIFYKGELVPWKRVYLQPPKTDFEEWNRADISSDDLSVGSMSRIYPFRGEVPMHTVLLYVNSRHAAMYESFRR